MHAYTAEVVAAEAALQVFSYRPLQGCAWRTQYFTYRGRRAGFFRLPNARCSLRLALLALVPAGAATAPLNSRGCLHRLECRQHTIAHHRVGHAVSLLFERIARSVDGKFRLHLLVLFVLARSTLSLQHVSWLASTQPALDGLVP